MLLSLFWASSSAFIITIGAATSALYYTIIKCMREENGKISTVFWHSFFENLKQSTFISVIFLLTFVVLILDIYLVYRGIETQNFSRGLLLVLLIILISIIQFFMLVFSYISRFRDKTRKVFSNCILIYLCNIPRMLFCALLSVVGCLMMLRISVSIILVPGVFTYFMSYHMEKVFMKYLPENNTMLK